MNQRISISSMLVAVMLAAASAAMASAQTYTADLSGRNEVPPAPEKVTGVAQLSGDLAGGLSFHLSANSNGEQLTAAHFHCGALGANGPIVVSLFSDPRGKAVNGGLAGGPLRDSDIAASGAACASVIGFPIRSVQDFMKAVDAGDIYANIHSLAYPDGASRGQLMPSR